MERLSASGRIATAVAWNVVAGVGARSVGLLGTLVLARFLSPDDYGQVSVAAICVMTTMQITNLQLGQYLIVKGLSERSSAFTAAAVHVSLGAAALGVILLARDSLGPMLGAPGMGRYVPGFALAMALERCAQIPEGLLARDLRFRLISTTRGIGEVWFTALALACAPSIGAMGIVVGNIGRSALVLVVFAAAADRQWMTPVAMSWSKTLEMLRFSLPLATANATDFAAGRWDNLLVSRYNGSSAAGEYNLAFNLSSTSTGALADQVLDVLFPSFAEVDPRHRGDALARAMSAMALLVMPLAFGLATIAGTVVSALFPLKWAPIAPMLVVLSVQAAAVPMASTLQAFYGAQGRTGLVMVSSLFRLGTLMGGLIAVGPWGPTWSCIAVDVSALACLGMLWCVVGVEAPTLLWPAMRGALQALLACVPMVVCVVAVQALEARLGPVPPAWAVVPEIGAGAIGYVAGAFLFAKPTTTTVLALGRQLVRRATGPSRA